MSEENKNTSQDSTPHPEPQAPERVSIRQNQPAEQSNPQPADQTEVLTPPGTPVTGKPPATGKLSDLGIGMPEKKRSKKSLWVTLGILAAVAAGYVGLAFYCADRVPAHTTVAGVDISGLAQQSAVDVLNEQLGPLVTEPIEVKLGEKTSTIDPAAAGLAFDAEATVEPLVTFSLNPTFLWNHIAGGGEAEPATTVDDAALQAELQRVNSELQVAPVDGEIAIRGGAPHVTEPVVGVSMDEASATDVVKARWLVGSRPIELPAESPEPPISQQVIDQVLTTHIEPLLKSPITLESGEYATTLVPEEVAELLTLEHQDGAISVGIDAPALHGMLQEKLPDLEVKGKDAKIVLKDGKPAIEPHVVGQTVDAEALATDLVEQISADAQSRTVELQVVEAEPEFTTEDAEALGVKEEISFFSTPMPYDPVRTTNLEVGTKKINGTLVLPGETFSLLEALSPITAAEGYTSSGVVVNGFASNAVGGGLSQLSTTTFNAAFEAGMTDVTHQPHSRWFSRYPEGREATIYEGSIDMQWKNNTPYGVLVQAWVADNQTKVRLWGTKYWDVKITTGERYNITEPSTRYNEAPDCVPESGGQSGFSVNYTRTVSRDGEVNQADSRSYSHTYVPWHRTVCGPKPTNTPKPETETSSSSDADS